MNITKDNIINELKENPKLVDRLVKYIDKLEMFKQSASLYAKTDEGREYYRQKASNYYDTHLEEVRKRNRERYWIKKGMNPPAPKNKSEKEKV